MAKFNSQKLAKRVREKRGKRTVREVADELQIGIATISRIENGKQPKLDIFSIIVEWLVVQCQLRWDGEMKQSVNGQAVA